MLAAHKQSILPNRIAPLADSSGKSIKFDHAECSCGANPLKLQSYCHSEDDILLACTFKKIQCFFRVSMQVLCHRAPDPQNQNNFSLTKSAFSCYITHMHLAARVRSLKKLRNIEILRCYTRLAMHCTRQITQNDALTFRILHLCMMLKHMSDHWNAKPYIRCAHQCTVYIAQMSRSSLLHETSDSLCMSHRSKMCHSKAELCIHVPPTAELPPHAERWLYTSLHRLQIRALH